jgi:hypothetical protein
MGGAGDDGSEGPQGEARAGGGWNPLSPMLAWLTTMQELGTVALGSTEAIQQLSQSQWTMLREGMALMSKLPLSALDESDRELRRLREAVRAVQFQMEVFDQQLEALDQMLHPLHDWADAWRGLIERPKE